MYATKDTKTNEIEITPKREKIWLAAAYCTTAVTGGLYWSVKDSPRTDAGRVFVDDGNGKIVAKAYPSGQYWFFTSIFAASVLLLLCVKIRIWWRHY